MNIIAKILRKSFSKIDIFHFPLTFYLNGSEKTKTYSGKIFTYIIFFYIIYSFFNSDLMKKTNPTISQQTFKLSNRPDILLPKGSFFAAIGLLNEKNVFLADPTIVNITLNTIKKDNVSSQKAISIIELDVCNIDNITNIFFDFPEPKAYCLFDTELKLQGYLNEQTMQSFSFEVNKCQNSSENNDHCQTPEIIDKVLSSFKINLYFTSNTFDLDSPGDLINNDYDLFSQDTDVNQKKILNIFLKNSEMLTNDGFYFNNKHLISTFQQSYTAYDTSIINENINKTIFQANFYADNTKFTITRKYQNFQDLLAQMGGILHLIVIIGTMIAKLENKFNFMLISSNELFIFDQEPLYRHQKGLLTLSTIYKAKKSKELTELPQIRMAPENPLFKLNETPGLFSPELPLRNNSPMKVSLPMCDSIINKIEKSPVSNLKKNLFTHPKAKVYDDFEPFPENENFSLKNSSADLQKNELSKDKSFLDINVSKDEDLMSSELKIPRNPTNVSVISKDEESAKLKIPRNPRSVSVRKKSWKQEIMLFTEKIKKSFSPGTKNESKEKMKRNLGAYLKIKRKESKFNIGRLGYLKLLLKNKKWRLSDSEKLFLKGEEEILKEMDLLEILKRLQDVEKIKSILFSKEQLYFFKLLSKPIIKLEEQNKPVLIYAESPLRKKTDSEDEEAWEIKKIMELYSKLQENAKFSDIDKRILNLLDKDVCAFIENEHEFRQRK